MKLLISLLLFVLILSCVRSDEVKTTILSDQDDCFDYNDDAFFVHILKHGIKGTKLSELHPTPKIEFNSGESVDSISFFKYSFWHWGLKYEFLLEHYPLAKRSVYLNQKKVEVIRYFEDSDFNVDSFDLNIDYSDSNFYDFGKDSSHLLVVSTPMRWVGTMTIYSLFQLIYKKEKKVIEFIREREI